MDSQRRTLEWEHCRRTCHGNGWLKGIYHKKTSLGGGTKVRLERRSSSKDCSNEVQLNCGGGRPRLGWNMARCIVLFAIMIAEVQADIQNLGRVFLVRRGCEFDVYPLVIMIGTIAVALCDELEKPVWTTPKLFDKLNSALILASRAQELIFDWITNKDTCGYCKLKHTK